MVTPVRPQGKTLYALFGLAPDATQTQIEAAHRALQKAHGGNEQRLEQINKAYELLSNPVRRSVYDASLSAGQAQLVEVGTPTQTQQQARQATQHAGIDHPSVLDWIKHNILIVLGVVAVLIGVLIWRQQVAEKAYQADFRAAQARAMALKMEVLAQEAANGNGQQTTSYQSSEQSAAEREAQREREKRDREYQDWDRKVASEQRQQRYEDERRDRQQQYEREREAQQLNNQKERDQQAYAQRMERERQVLMSKLLNEKRYGEARGIAKTSYEMDRIASLEKYSR
ncbi:DnaJ domain-containing protein [Chitinimonas naiadis]